MSILLPMGIYPRYEKLLLKRYQQFIEVKQLLEQGQKFKGSDSSQPYIACSQVYPCKVGVKCLKHVEFVINRYFQELAKFDAFWESQNQPDPTEGDLFRYTKPITAFAPEPSSRAPPRFTINSYVVTSVQSSWSQEPSPEPPLARNSLLHPKPLIPSSTPEPAPQPEPSPSLVKVNEGVGEMIDGMGLLPSQTPAHQYKKTDECL
ncbi:hypothetical protein UY3_05257 [Chelonia mydas]|uniref:Uncharacterized protein n=1 Tax=Chelonia mydas TaxID=8469 RepID=M7BZM6_CHEMY|nr:hypothetical protein UY3_05257 [Chelonia mydas]